MPVLRWRQPSHYCFLNVSFTTHIRFCILPATVVFVSCSLSPDAFHITARLQNRQFSSENSSPNRNTPPKSPPQLWCEQMQAEADPSRPDKLPVEDWLMRTPYPDPTAFGSPANKQKKLASQSPKKSIEPGSPDGTTYEEENPDWANREVLLHEA